MWGLGMGRKRVRDYGEQQQRQQHEQQLRERMRLHERLARMDAEMKAQDSERRIQQAGERASLETQLSFM